MENAEMIGTSTVAKRLGVSVTTARKLMLAGEIPCLRVTSHSLRVRVMDLDAFVASRSTGHGNT